jgi:thioredoxin-related protein
MKRISICLPVLLFFFGISLSQISFSQVKEVSFEQLDSLEKKEKKPVIIFLHASWCTYCSMMQHTTLKHAAVVKLLNQYFYFVSLDIEEKRDIRFQGHTFSYMPTGVNTGIHQLAEQLGTFNGQLAYPGLCFLNAGYEIIYQREGYIGAKEFLKIVEKVK